MLTLIITIYSLDRLTSFFTKFFILMIIIIILINIELVIEANQRLVTKHIGKISIFSDNQKFTRFIDSLSILLCFNICFEIIKLMIEMNDIYMMNDTKTTQDFELKVFCICSKILCKLFQINASALMIALQRSLMHFSKISLPKTHLTSDICEIF